MMNRRLLAPTLALLASVALSTRPAMTQGPARAQDSVRAGDSALQPAPSIDSMIVFVTKTGAKYHLAGCSSLKSSAIPMLLVDARKRYGPCGRCHPPQ
jgi:hypothetical protein